MTSLSRRSGRCCRIRSERFLPVGGGPHLVMRRQQPRDVFPHVGIVVDNQHRCPLAIGGSERRLLRKDVAADLLYRVDAIRPARQPA